MKKTYIVAKNELLRYFFSPLAYVYLISFLILNGSFAFYFGAFFARGQANLDSMFSFQPWLYLIFIPGISMRLWAEEFKSKTIIQIITMPVSISSLVWGKFFAAWCFTGIALTLTFPFWISINILGNPDNMVIFVGYISSFLVSGCILAISMTMSALTKNQVIALVLSFFANLVFFLSGIEFILGIIRPIAPTFMIDTISSFSFLTHFNTMIKGVIELSDIVFTLSIVILFNLLTTLVITFKTSGTSKLLKSSNKSYYILICLCVLFGFLGINLISNNLLRNIQHDFTEEKLYTLSNSTKEVLQNMPNTVVAKVYYSPILGQRNHNIRIMFERLKILLDKYASLSDGKFIYKIYNPEFLDSVEDMAIASGMQPIPIIDLNQNGYFGLSLSDEVDNKNNIPLFTLERQGFIEQDITQKLYELYHQPKTVAILSSLPLGDTTISSNSILQRWEITNYIEELYNVKFVGSPEDINAKDFDVLMIVHPTSLSDDMVEAIKEYSFNNGKIFLALDAATESIKLFSFAINSFEPSDLRGLDEVWGFKFHNDLVIADLDNSIAVDATQNYKTMPTFTQDVIQPKLQGDSINHNLLETASLKSILFASASPITLESDDIYFIPLLKASSNSELMPISVVYNNIPPQTILRYFKADNYDKYIAARIISKDKSKPFEIIVVGDTDFMYDTFWSEYIYLLEQQYNIPILDNANFVLNSLDTLSGDTILIPLRGKSPTNRNFKDIEKLRIKAQQDFSIKEGETLEKISQTKSSLQEVWHKKDFEGRDTFSADEMAVIANARQTLNNLRQELNSIRVASHQEIKNIEILLKLVNIYAIPLILLFIVAGYSLAYRRKRHISSSKLHINKEFITIATISIFFLISGLIVVYLSGGSKVDSYENKPVFTEVKQHINDISNISIKSHNTTLNFYKENTTWYLKGYEDFPVYQERIRSFLSALIEATYYEKKSAKAENLYKFGLSPIEDSNSSNTHVELITNQGKTISSFEVGDYNIDLGRGEQAAYIKFDSKFQVWLIAADFIDLSSSWQDWTYSTLWNLRFGRVVKINQIQDIDTMADIVKDALNIKLIGINNNHNGNIISQLELLTEDGDLVKIQVIKDNDKYLVKYSPPIQAKNQSLHFIGQYIYKNFYEIDNADLMRLENVINTVNK